MQVLKGVVKKKRTFDDKKDNLFNTTQKKEHLIKSIRSDKYKLKSVMITKSSLSCFDNKRYIFDGGINALLYGDYMINCN